MSKIYSESELRAMGMDEEQIVAIMAIYDESKAELESKDLPIDTGGKVVRMEHKVSVSTPKEQLVPTSLEQIASYKGGVVVELPPFADGQPFVARLSRPSLLVLVKAGRIPNTLINQATSLFANGAGALNGNGKNSANLDEFFKVIDVIVGAALLEPTLDEIRSVGMELSDDQLMAIFSYTQRGIKALENFRTE